MFHKYAYQLAEKDCEKKGLRKIDLGGGINGRPGYETRYRRDGRGAVFHGMPLFLR